MNTKLALILLALVSLFLAYGSLKPTGPQTGIPSAQVSQTPISQDDPVALKHLIQRLFSSSFFSITPEAQVGVYLGKLPEALPVELPIPKSAKIAGSVLVPNTTMTAVGDVPQSKDDVLAFYTDQLQALGWTEQGPRVSISKAQSQFTFCLKAKNLALQVSALEKAPNASDLRLLLLMDPKYGGCLPITHVEESSSMATDVSDLSVLASERLISQSGAGGTYDHSTTLIFDTDLEVQAILDNFVKQLEAKGWRQLESGSGPSLHWSTWTYQDQEKQTWNGVLDLFQSPQNSSRYFLAVHSALMIKGK